MDLTCGLGDKLRDMGVDLICEQFRYLACYGQNIEQLDRQSKELVRIRSNVQHQVDEATNNAEEILEGVLDWFKDAHEILEQVKKFPKEENPNLWLRYKLSKIAKEMAEKAAYTCGQCDFARVSYRVPPKPIYRESDEELDSRVLIVNQLLEALRNPSFDMVGLCGVGGVGKTTIARQLQKQAGNQKIFEKVIMATVSCEPNIKNIQSQIVDMLGVQFEEKTEEAIASRLLDNLKKQKNMLLILDDLWKELDFYKVGIPVSSTGCKILLTSRDQKLLLSRRDMKCQHIVKVDLLLEDEALKLFERIAEFSIGSSEPELISIATKIVQKSGGLPLAIAAAAKALRMQDLDCWKDALRRLSHPLSRSVTGINEGDSVLRLSYDRLSLSEYKNVFLLAAMLSHDPSIEDLLMYSVGWDILEGIEDMSMEAARNAISRIVSKLKSLDLFIDSISSHQVTMHDFFRDLALSIASRESHLFTMRHRKLKGWPNKDLEGCKGLCLQECEISDVPEELHGPELEFFLLNGTGLTIPNTFFKSAKKLKLLGFTNVQFSSLPSLSFQNNVKALCLHSCVLADITEVRSLKNLTILSLANSEIQMLPLELAELTCLQMLNLFNCKHLQVIPQKILSNLKNLEVLYMRNSFDQWEVEGSSESNENASLAELMDLPFSSLEIQIPNVSMLPHKLFLDMNLESYKIFIGKNWERQESKYEVSKMLKLKLEESSDHLMPGVRKLLEAVEDLYLLGSNNALENFLHNQDGRGFRCLKHLKINGDDDITHQDDFNFPLDEDAANKSFESLFNKEVKSDDDDDIAQDGINSPHYEDSANKSFKSHFNKVLWDDQLSHNSFRRLKTLTVKRCNFVKLLVPLHVLKSLNNLEELNVGFCDILEMVFDFEDWTSDNKEIIMESSSSIVVPLKKLKLWRLPKMKNVWRNHSQGDISFQNLRSVHVKYCESLTSIFPASIAKGMLHNLEEISIANCDIDVIVARDQISESAATAFEFPRLTFLELSFLSNLRNFYPGTHTLEWPHLQRINIEFCDELEIFEKKVSSSSEIHEGESQLKSKYTLLSHDKVIIGHLEELRLCGKIAEMMGIGQFSTYQFPNVKMLDLYCKKATTISYRSLLEGFPNLEELDLWGDFIEPTGGDDVSTIAAPLAKLSIYKISNIVSLGQVLVVFSQNLTYLHVGLCHELTSLMTLSTARSLVNLTHLSVHSCGEMEEIISKQEGANDKDKGLIFSKLEFLKLSNLQSLKRFCGHNYTFKLPLLEWVIIMNCPQLTMFCSGAIHTPQLESIHLDYQEIWNTNLNKTLLFQQFDESSGDLVFGETHVSTISNGQFPLDRCPEVKILRIIEFVGEVDTLQFPYTLLQRLFPKLEKLHVEDSSFEEIFPSSKAHIGVQTPPLKELYLSYLDKLKNIWKDDSQLLPLIHQDLTMLEVKSCCNLVKLAPSSASFQHLTTLEVSTCHELIHLVTSSTAKSLVGLRRLEISDCEKMEEIVINAADEEDEGGIMFNSLHSIKLSDMPSLKMFSSQSHILEFPELEEIEIIGCPQMKMVCPGLLGTPNLFKVKIEEHDVEWENERDLNKTIEMLSSAKDCVDL